MKSQRETSEKLHGAVWQGVLSFARGRRSRLRYVQTAEEADVLRACLRYLLLAGIPHWRANAGAARLQHQDGSERFVRFGIEGQSDILGVIPGTGRFLAVETKAPGGRLSDDQVAFLEMVNRAGGLGIVARSAEELAEQLDQLKLSCRQETGTRCAAASTGDPLEELRAVLEGIRRTSDDLTDVTPSQQTELLRLLDRCPELPDRVVLPRPSDRPGCDAGGDR